MRRLILLGLVTRLTHGAEPWGLPEANSPVFHSVLD